MTKLAKHLFFVAFALSFAVWPPLAAQMEPGQWANDLYLVRAHEHPPRLLFLDENNGVRDTVPSAAKAADISISLENLSDTYSFWHNGAVCTMVWSHEKDDAGRRHNRWAFARWQEGEWHYLGNYKTEPGVLLHFFPCDDGRFILISSDRDLDSNNRPDRSPFARASFPEGKTELRVESSIDHGQDELRKYMAGPKCFGLAWSSQVILTEGRATLLNYSTGLYWVFSLEKAALVKAGNIFSKVTPEMAAKGGFSQAVLCANPEKEGTVLVSAVEESFFTTETKNPFDIVNKGTRDGSIKPEEATSELMRLLEERAQRNPHINWYRIHPNGKAEKLGAPPVGAELVRDGEKNLNEVWRPMPDGSVKMGHIREAIFPSRPPEQAEKADQKAEGQEPPPTVKTDEPPPKTEADPKK